jgi:hypothetical protein
MKDRLIAQVICPRCQKQIFCSFTYEEPVINRALERAQEKGFGVVYEANLRLNCICDDILSGYTTEAEGV